MYLFIYIGIVLLLAFLALSFFPRWLCLTLGLLCLMLGIIFPLLVWSHAHAQVPGDKSSYGMLGTIFAMLFAPLGLVMSLIGMLKRN